MATTRPTLHVTANGIDFACIERGDGPLALCLHGFPDTPHSFEPLLSDLAAAGYRAVAPYLRGYAPTGLAPDGRYDLAALAADAEALRVALGGGSDSVVIGHDWGAVIAHQIAHDHAGQWAKVVLMSVPPPPYFAQNLFRYDQLKHSFYMWFFQLTVAEKVVSSHNFAFLDQLWRDWSPGIEPGEALDAVRKSLAEPAHLNAALEYYRATFAGMRLDAKPPTDPPVPPSPLRQSTLYLHGARDGCVTVDAALVAQIPHQLGPGSRAELLPDVGHFLLNEQPGEISERILTFLAA